MRADNCFMSPPPRSRRKPLTKLGERRKKLGLTQKQLALGVGVGLGTIRDLEQRCRPPKIQLLMRCAVVLRCNLETLIDDKWWKFDDMKIEPVAPPGMPKTQPSRDERCLRCGGATLPTRRVRREQQCLTCRHVFIPPRPGILSVRLPSTSKAA